MLAKLSLVKERLGIPQSETAQDKILNFFIKMTSHRFEKECNRFFARKENFCEEFPADETEIIVCRYPIESIATIEVSPNSASGWQPVNDLIYIIRNQCIVSLSRPVGNWTNRAKIIYTGGFVLPGNPCLAGQTPLPEDIELACTEQTVYSYQNRERLGLVGFAGLRSDYQKLFDSSPTAPSDPNNNIRMFLQFERIDLLPCVVATISRYKRKI